MIPEIEQSRKRLIDLLVTDPLMTAEEVGKLCKVSQRTVSERWSSNPDFVTPEYLPAGKGGRSVKLWSRAKIYERYNII